MQNLQNPVSDESKLSKKNAMEIRESIHHLHVRHSRRINRTGFKVFRIEDYLHDLEPDAKVKLSIE